MTTMHQTRAVQLQLAVWVQTFSMTLAWAAKTTGHSSTTSALALQTPLNWCHRNRALRRARPCR